MILCTLGIILRISMASICSACDIAIPDDSAVECAGYCGRIFDLPCARIDSTIFRSLLSNSGLIWRRPACRNISLSDRVTEAINDQLEIVQAKLQCLFNNLKHELLDNDSVSIAASPYVIRSSASPVITLSYAQAASSVISKIIIRPKASGHKLSKIKADVLECIDPIVTKLDIHNVRNISNDGIVVKDKTYNDSSQILKLAGESLSNGYEVRQLKSILPKIRVVEMTQVFEEETFTSYVLKQNADLFSSFQSSSPLI